MTVYEAPAFAWPKILRFLKELDLSPRKSGAYFITRGESRWTADPTDVIGAVLGPEDVQGAENGSGDFDPSLPGQCRGYVAPGRPIVGSTLPRGRLASVGNDLVFHDGLIRLLGSTSGVITHSVQVRGKIVPGWHGFRLSDSCDAVDPRCFAPQATCALCGSPYRSWNGVWVGNRHEIPENPAYGRLGFEHLDLDHPIVVNPARAIRIARMCRNGICTDPIYDATGPTGKSVLELQAMVSEILYS